MAAAEPLFLIVDDDSPRDQAAQLQESLRLAGLSGRVEYAASPAEMLEIVTGQMPSLILLDHHWPEVLIEKILQDLRRDAPSSRVVLYTGKTIEPSTIIDCARYGVAEYLMKSSIAGDSLAKKLSILAKNPDNTLERLGSPSGAVQQLIQEARKNLSELESERGIRIRLENENVRLKDGDQREIRMQVLRFGAALIYLFVAAILTWEATKWGGFFGFGCYVVAAALGMFVLDRTVSTIGIRYGERFHLGVSRKTNEEKTP